MPDSSCEPNDVVAEGAAIRCIAFDACGTLIYADPPVAMVYGEVGRRHGSRRTDVEIAERFAEADGAFVRQGDLATSDPREHARWRAVVGRVLDDVRDSEACFAELFAHFGTPAAWSCFDDVSGAIATLRSRGFALAIASNFDSRLLAICDGLAPLRSIELRVISSVVGFSKPSPRFFAALVERAGVSPGEVLMVGDDFQRDIEGANRAGLRAVRVARGEVERESASIASLAELTERLA